MANGRSCGIGIRLFSTSVPSVVLLTLLVAAPFAHAQLWRPPSPESGRVGRDPGPQRLRNFESIRISRGAPTWCDLWGFEQGSFGSWQCVRATYAGDPVPVDCLLLPSVTPVPRGLDPQLSFAGASLNQVPADGGRYSLRFGDTSAGPATWSVNGVRRSFVPTASPLYVRYAVVFQDAHVNDPGRRAFFLLRLKDSNGVPVFTDYRTLASTEPGFQGAGGGLAYLPWQYATIDMGPWVGRTIELEATVSDCAADVHWAYAYLDFSCLPLAATISSEAPEQVP